MWVCDVEKKDGDGIDDDVYEDDDDNNHGDDESENELITFIIH